MVYLQGKNTLSFVKLAGILQLLHKYLTIN